MTRKLADTGRLSHTLSGLSNILSAIIRLDEFDFINHFNDD